MWTTERSNNLRSYLLMMCRGYWFGTTCGNKKGYQRALADIRRLRHLEAR